MFHAEADFSVEGWNKAYHIWSELKDLFVIITFCTLSRYLMNNFFLIIYYAFVRLCIEVITIGHPLEAVNIPEMVDRLYLISLGAIILIIINDLIQWNQRHY